MLKILNILKFKTLLLLTLAFFTVLMVRLTIPYFSFDDHTAFLRIKQWIIHNSVWKTAFYVHVISSCFTLLAGFTQFSGNFLRKYPMLHRYLGRLNGAVILLLSGPSGLIMALYANGGLLSQSAFFILSILWLAFTYLAYHYARSGDIPRHRKFMVRSFALTLSAITLRGWKLLIVLAFRPHPMDAYTLVAFLGWIPNLIIAEIYIRKVIEKRNDQK
ncbi:MAG: DUF2306 domain-containing protein [Cytophagaceae bacterium]